MPTSRYRRRRPEEREHFTLPVNQPKGPRPGPEILPWYWHPDRDGIQQAPDAFRARLTEIHPDLRMVFSPVHERWILWVKNPRIRGTPVLGNRGWQLLMIWEHAKTKAFLPLSELVFHNLGLIDAQKYDKATQYYDRIQTEWERNRARREATLDQDTHDRQEDMRKSLTVISTAGKGNRAAMQDADAVPSRGLANWERETRKWRMPAELLQREKDEKEQRRYGR